MRSISPYFSSGSSAHLRPSARSPLKVPDSSRMPNTANLSETCCCRTSRVFLPRIPGWFCRGLFFTKIQTEANCFLTKVLLSGFLRSPPAEVRTIFPIQRGHLSMPAGHQAEDEADKRSDRKGFDSICRKNGTGIRMPFPQNVRPGCFGRGFCPP